MNEKIYLEILDSYIIGPSELIIVILQSPGYALKRGYTLESERTDKWKNLLRDRWNEKEREN
ncbi:MAG: hypothetical protein AAFR87_28020 [Bacteroidota bacterium]